MEIIAGYRFGKRTVLDVERIKKGKEWYRAVLCDCGTIGFARESRIKIGETGQCRRCSGKTRTPPCKRHGMHSTPTYSTWEEMKRRCQNKRSPRYKDYGGRGIYVCERWQLFDNFFADMGVKPEGLQIDRSDNSGPYAPGNCRWVTPLENARNKRPYPKNRKSRIIKNKEIVAETI